MRKERMSRARRSINRGEGGGSDVHRRVRKSESVLLTDLKVVQETKILQLQTIILREE